jgi:hypothetical protein
MNDIYERYLGSLFIRLNIPSREAFEYMAQCYLDWYGPYLPKNKDAKFLLDFSNNHLCNIEVFDHENRL